jgi:O-antigen/teichoic acid export membrane protein
MDLTGIGLESARGSFFLMAGTAGSTIMGAIAAILIARLLGPAGYGLYTLAFVLPSLIAAIVDFGLSPALTRYGASLRVQQKYRKLASMISSGFLFSLVVGIGASLLVFALSGQLAAFVLQRQEMGQLLLLASACIPFQVFFNLAYQTFVGLDRMEQGALVAVLRNVTTVIVSPVLIVVGFGTAGAILGQVVGWMVAGLVAVWLLLAHWQAFRKMPSELELRNGKQADIGTMMGYGLPLYVVSLLTATLAQYQRITLAFFVSDTEIGNFSAAFNFGMLVSVVATPITTSLFPAFSKLDLETRKDDVKRMFKLSVKYVTFVIFPAAIAIATLSKDLVRAVYGASYIDASSYLTLYILTWLLLWGGSGLGNQLITNFFGGIGRSGEALKVSLVQLFVLLPAGAVMAWLYRVPGSIFAVILSALVSIIFGLSLAFRRYGIQVDVWGLLRALAASLASTLPILPIVYYSPLPSLVNVLIAAPIYLAAYLTVAPLFGAVKRADLQVLIPILGQIKILKSATGLILAYETLVLNIVERQTKSTVLARNST